MRDTRSDNIEPAPPNGACCNGSIPASEAGGLSSILSAPTILNNWQAYPWNFTADLPKHKPV